MSPTPSSGAAGAPLDKTFDPAAIEAKWYAHWEANGLFRPERPEAEPFTIVNPPPNVTGSLHVGHALDNTLQDIVVRYERLRGKDALWVVGTDHAGIATQMVVERQLEERQDKRTNYTREQFVEKVWEWKAESGGTITGQLRRLGCSMDWSREQFTMDPHFSKAVTKVFVDLYNTIGPDGKRLIYRDKRLVNWDPKLKTAISDLEVETREVPGKFWHFRYPLADGVKLADGRNHIVVATTRPETMLADMAVAVNGADERYASVIGQHVLLPITGRRVPIIADDHADPELGSGAVKITPGHDFNDFEVGKRAGFKPGEMLNMLDAEARVVQTTDGLIPDDLIGLDRFDARERVVAMLDGAGLLGAIDDRTIATPFGDRGGVVIEPWLTDQWYVDAEKLAHAPIQAVRDGSIEIVPKSWEKTFFNWMENIQPWCVSRQLWWGHRIPAWYGPTQEALATGRAATIRLSTFDERERIVALDEDGAREIAAARYQVPPRAIQFETEIFTIGDGKASRSNQGQGGVILRRDPDVLDTWFSSALWPFATLGWPESARPPSSSEEGSGGGGDAAGGAREAMPRHALHHPPTPSSEEEGGKGSRSLLARHYPNDLLISGFDILFFWCARMAMMGMHTQGEVPWKRLYLHGLVRAADGQKMSKSKGNVVDPLGLIDRYGADALRFFMASMESQGRDVKMDEKRVEGYRNFATKLWNAARFCQANGIGASATLGAPSATLAVNKWIIGEVVETVAALDAALAELRFDAAANTIYHFVWDRFCDWYLELVKGAIDDETRTVAGWVFDQILVMLHPFMPFVTEELWNAMGEREDELIVAEWPEPGAEADKSAQFFVEWQIELISAVRNLRAGMSIPWSAKLAPIIIGYDPGLMELLEDEAPTFARLAGIGRPTTSDYPPSGAVQIVVRDATIAFPLEGLIDIDAEKARLDKARAASEKERQALAKRLANPAFIDKAKPEAVEKARADHAAHAAEAERLAAALARLG